MKTEAVLEKHNILIAEDENDIMEFLIDLLEEDYDITSAEDVPQALSKIDEKEFDIIITDLRMPGGSGLDVLEKAKYKSIYTEVIIMTGYGTLETVTKAMKLGITSYLLKPFSTHEFFSQVVRASASRKMNQCSSKIVDIIPEKYTELRDYARMLKYMQDFLFSISKTIDHQELISYILQEICDKANINSSYLIIKNENILNMYTYGLDQDLTGEDTKIIIEKGTEVWQEQPHFEKEKFIYPSKIPEKNHLLSKNPPETEIIFNFMISIPIMLRGQVFGVIFFSLESFHDLSESTSQYFHLIAKMTSSALDNAFYHLKTKKMAHQDGLTGLNNHQSFQTHLNKKLNQTQESKRPLSLILFDIDNFKKINDTYGHQVGDDVLRTIGLLLSEDTRMDDIASRYGGEEFTLILPETTLEQGFAVAERIRELVATQTYIDSNEKPFTVTISLGLSIYDGKGEVTNKDLINEADSALYEAKRSGKNKTIVYEKK